jgi:hypothetical protein
MPTWFKDWSLSGCVQGGAATISCLPTIFFNVLTALIMFVGLTALIMFLLGSFRLLSSRGDPKKIQGIKNVFTYGILGLVIVLLAFVIINIISIFTGVGCIRSGHFGFGC